MPASGTHALVLAAGAGRRFGGDKLCSSFGGKPLILWSTESALESGVDAVTVVLGSYAERVRDVLKSIGDQRLRTLVCPDWNDGLSASVRCGTDNLPADTRALLVFLGDMPLVPVDLARRVLAAVIDGAPAAMPVCDGHPAHPVAVTRALFPELRRLTGDKGARGLLEALPGAVRISTDDIGSIRDVDTPEHLRDLQESALSSSR